MNVSLDQQDLERITDAVIGRLGDGHKRTQWLTRAEAAEHIRCSTRKFDQLVRLGEIRAYRPAGRPLFRIEELDTYVEDTVE